MFQFLRMCLILYYKNAVDGCCKLKKEGKRNELEAKNFRSKYRDREGGGKKENEMRNPSSDLKLSLTLKYFTVSICSFCYYNTTKICA